MIHRNTLEERPHHPDGTCQHDIGSKTPNTKVPNEWKTLNPKVYKRKKVKLKRQVKPHVTNCTLHNTRNHTTEAHYTHRNKAQTGYTIHRNPAYKTITHQTENPNKRHRNDNIISITQETTDEREQEIKQYITNKTQHPDGASQNWTHDGST